MASKESRLRVRDVEVGSSSPQATRDGFSRIHDAGDNHIINHEYRNSLLFVIGWLDLINALDFPANVWNERPTPFFAQVLEGVFGSIMLLGTYFSIKDSILSWQNIRFLRQERRNLHHTWTTNATPTTRSVIEACLQLNKRELGWEVFDRLLLDLTMAISSLCVGAGTLLAIRGDIDAVFEASNLLSGYVGNSFIAAYACANIPWCIFMWIRGSRHLRAVKTASMDRKLSLQMTEHARRHQLYACTTAFTITVSGVGSLMSAQHWPGYVVLIPGIIGSVFVNWFWRHRLGYNRRPFTTYFETSIGGGGDILSTLESIAVAKGMLDERGRPCRSSHTEEEKYFAPCADYRFVHILGLQRELHEQVSAATPITYTGSVEAARRDAEPSDSSHVDHASFQDHQLAVQQVIHSAGANYFRDLERFTMELYGNWLDIIRSQDTEMTELRRTRDVQ